MNTQRTTRQTLVAKEGLAALWSLVALGLASLLWPLAPVGSGDGGQAAAPWIFLALQELLRWLPPLLAGVSLPLVALAFLALLPWLGPGQGPALPTWRRWAMAEIPFWLLLAAWLGLTLRGLWR